MFVGLDASAHAVGTAKGRSGLAERNHVWVTVDHEVMAASGKTNEPVIGTCTRHSIKCNHHAAPSHTEFTTAVVVVSMTRNDSRQLHLDSRCGSGKRDGAATAGVEAV